MLIKKIKYKKDVLKIIMQNPPHAIIFKRMITERPAYAWVPNGAGWGYLYSARDIKRRLRNDSAMRPYGGDQRALDVLIEFCEYDQNF